MASRATGSGSENKNLIAKVLGDPSLFPDAFKQWIPRWVQYNVNFKLQKTQLPTVDTTHLVGGTGNAAFAGAWANAGGTNASASYWIDLMGVVHLDGVVASGSVPSTIFTLPVGYRPRWAEVYIVASNGTVGICTINPDGTVVASSGSNVYFSLSGINFRQFA